MNRPTAITWLVMALYGVGGLSAAHGGEDGKPPVERGSSIRQLTLQDCVTVGLERNAKALNARRDQEIATARIHQARALALPHVGVTASYRRLDELQEVDFGEDLVELGTLDNYSVEGEVSQLLYAGGRVRAALSAARSTRDLAEASRFETEQELTRDITVAFNNILLARAGIQVYEESLKHLESLLAQSEEKLKHGTGAEFDVISAKVRVANERPLLIRARNAYAVALEALRRQLALGDGPFELRGGLTYAPKDFDLDALQRAALGQRAALKALESTVSLYERDMESAQADGRPNVSLFATYNGANAYTFVAYEDNWEWHWNAGVSVSWNFWDGGMTRGIVREKALTLAKSRTDLEDLRLAVKLEVKRAGLEVQYAREAVESGKGNVALAEKALRIARTRYDAGLVTYLEFTDATVALSRAKLSYWTALREHRNAQANLAYAVGIALKDVEKETGK